MPHEILQLDKWEFDFMLLCNEARVELDKDERDEKENNKEENVRYLQYIDEQEINEYINSLDEQERVNALMMMRLGVNPKPQVKINMHY